MSGEFLDLAGDPTLRRKITGRVQQVIAQSFAKDGARQTGQEIKRRFEIVESTIRMLRGDLGWAYERILDELPRALRAKLDGVPWDPSENRAIWTPPGAA